MNKTADVSLAEFNKADEALNGLQYEIDDFGDSPDIRDSFSEMCI